MEGKKKSLKDVLKNVRTEYVILIVLLVVALIIFFSFTGSSPKAETTSTTVEQYVELLENKMKNCLSKVKGAGKVDVIISVGSSMQTVFVTEKTVSSSGTAESPVIVSGKPVVLKEAYPEITGVVVVAEGAKNLSVRVDLLNACETFLAITEDKIRILAMK